MTLPRLYPILDTGLVCRSGLSPEAVAEALLDAGVRILQFRHKGPYTRSTFAQAQTIANLCRQAGALFVLNDRADIAALLEPFEESPAALHVGQDDLPPSLAKRVHPAGAIGFSTHNEAQFLAASEDPDVDYLALGPIFPTASKENPDPVVGLVELARLAAMKRHPLAAIGGITLERAAEVYDAGADSIALISALFPAHPTAENIRQRTLEWLSGTSVV